MKKYYLLPLLLCTACASTPQVKDDVAAAARSQLYVANVGVVPTGAKLSVSAPCALPPESEGEFNRPSKDWKNLVARANKCVSTQDWRTLSELGNLLARSDFDSPWGAYFLSLAAEGMKQMPRSLWMIDLAQKKSGGKIGLFAYQKARVLALLNDTSRAMTEMQKALALEPELADGHLFMAEIYHRDSDLDKAGTHYMAALKTQPTSYRGLTGFAELKLLQGSTDAAIEFYARAASEHSGQLRPWLRLAHIYETVKKDHLLALSTYKNLKAKLESGTIKESPAFDLGAKIEALEKVNSTRLPAQARSMK